MNTWHCTQIRTFNQERYTTCMHACTHIAHTHTQAPFPLTILRRRMYTHCTQYSTIHVVWNTLHHVSLHHVYNSVHYIYVYTIEWHREHVQEVVYIARCTMKRGVHSTHRHIATHTGPTSPVLYDLSTRRNSSDTARRCRPFLRKIPVSSSP